MRWESRWLHPYPGDGEPASPASVASDVRDQYSFSEYLSFRGVTLSVAFLAVTGLALADKMSWHLRGIILVVGLGQVLEYVADTYYGLMQKYGSLDRISRPPVPPALHQTLPGASG